MTTVDRLACAATFHGTAAAYTWQRCRCADARADYTSRRRETRRAQGMPPPPPTVPAGRYRRMLRELLDGRTVRDVADRLGWSPTRVQALRRAKRIQQPTADRIEELHVLLLGDGRLPPLREADEALVEVAAGGGVPWERLPAAARVAVVALHRELRLPVVTSAARLGVSRRTVHRWLARAARAA